MLPQPFLVPESLLSPRSSDILDIGSQWLCFAPTPASSALTQTYKPTLPPLSRILSHAASQFPASSFRTPHVVYVQPGHMSPSAYACSGAYQALPPLLHGISDSKGFLSSSKRSSMSDTSTAASYRDFGNPPALSSGHANNRTNFNPTRCSLFIRQQPRAARAGPDGKDRRPIDPPPILQLLMEDFDPSPPADLAEMQSIFWVVHCKLVSAHPPRKDMSTLLLVSEDGSQEVQRLLLGTAVASPFHTKDDPDPNTMSSRFIPATSERSDAMGGSESSQSPQCPGTFFIFADLSVRNLASTGLSLPL